MLHIILLVAISIVSETDPIRNVVKEFHALKNEKSELAFIKQYKSNADPAIKAYVLAMQMKQIEYLYNPIKQFSLFNDYKKELSSLADAHSKNIHVRYVRLLIQEQAPGFLSYKSDILTDKAFLKILLEAKDDTDYLDKYILESTSL